MSFQEVLQNKEKQSTIRIAPSDDMVLTRLQELIWKFDRVVHLLKIDVDKIGTSRDSDGLRTTINRNIRETLEMMKNTEASIRFIACSQNRDSPRRVLIEQFIKTAKEFNEIMKRAQMSKPPIVQKEIVSEEEQEKQKLLNIRKEQAELISEEFGYVERDREEMVEELARNVSSVNAMFRDIEILVAERGVVIEETYGNKEIYSKIKVDEEPTTSITKRSTRCKKCFIALVVTVPILTIVLIMTLIFTLTHTRRSDS